MAAIPRKVNTRALNKKPLPAANKENIGGVKTVKTTKRGGATDLDIFGDELEKKYNIEGSNTLDIVYARQENDTANATIAAQAARLEELTRQLEAIEAIKGAEHNNGKVTADDGIITQPDVPMHDVDAPKAPISTIINSNAANDANAVLEGTEEDEDLPMADASAAENAKLRRLLAAARGDVAGDQGPEGPAPGSIPKPAGSSFNIQRAMHLGKSAKDHAKYKALQRCLRDLTLRAGINWEKQWADVSAEVKGKFFAVARETHPILARYHNDWATEAIVKQRNKLAHAAVAKKKAVKKAAASGSKKVASGSKKAKGKSKAVIPSDNDDDEELSNYEDDEGMEEDDD
ncbi:hypothetical protein B0H14DRAFT_3879991 [Mycena olivaceomarginata]|nr:hypothetical protein B0H14DRAFT_3879991 [Mycena olivaceomarginata]